MLLGVPCCKGCVKPFTSPPSNKKHKAQQRLEKAPSALTRCRNVLRAEKRGCRITVHFLEKSRPHNAAAHVSRRMRQGQKETRVHRQRLSFEVSLHHQRTLVVQAGTASSLKSVTALVVAGVFHLTRQTQALFNAAVTLGGFPFIMPREFRGPAYHSQATSNASLS